MRPRILAFVALASAVVGLGASIASLVDHLGGSPMFCTADGCATVRASVWSQPLGVPLPVIGIAFFTLACVLAFVPRPRTRKLVGGLGGGAAIGLIAIQAFVLETFCTLCLVADPAAIVYAVAALSGAATLRASWRAALAVPALAAVVLVLGAIGRDPARDLPVPDSVANEQRPGVVTIVEFVDFECPYCRQLDDRLARAIASSPHPVRIVRKMVPLPGHPHAVPAAMGWVSADAQGLGEPMAKALFATPPDQLTPAGIEAIVERLGGDIARYRASFAAESTRKRIEADMADARAADVQGLPTIFIGRERFAGADHTVDRLRAAIARARD